MLPLKQRFSAVLMSVFSLPSPYGIGGFGDETEAFLSFLKEGGFSAWQTLPFQPPDSGYSPYGGCSAFAGNPLYIDPKRLQKQGLLTAEEEQEAVYTGSPFTVDYSFVYAAKNKMLKRAFSRFYPQGKGVLSTFEEQNPWVKDYAFFMALKEQNNGAPWQEWPAEQRTYSTALLQLEQHRERVDFYRFEQWVFAEQYAAIKQYAEACGIAIIGDIPMYVSLDSVDVWKNPALFCLNEEYQPTDVAGVPPDAFSEEGQRWGNPLYDWAAHKKENFAWWLARIERCMQLYDLLRIDHFRAFASYYTIPAEEINAKKGVWKVGPGEALFDLVLERYPQERIIAEDLGVYGQDVERLLVSTGIRGMRVLQFGFSGDNSSHLPHRYSEHCVAYVGTHDNNTLLGWLWDCGEEERRRILAYCGFRGSDWGAGGYHSESCRCLIETVWRTAAAIAVIPFQDLCGFGRDARVNIPGVPKDNWRFRTTMETIRQVDKHYFKRINQLYFRD